MLKFITGFFLCLSLAAADTPNKETKKKKRVLESGRYFHHSKPMDKCQTSKECMEEAKSVCQSKKAKFLDCNEQYKGTWITTCECL